MSAPEQPEPGVDPEAPETTGPLTLPDEEREAADPASVPDEDEEAEEAEEAPEPEAEPVPDGPTPEDLAKREKDLAKLRKDTASRVSRIMGDDAPGIIECPTCTEVAPGWIWHPQIFPLEEATVAAMRQLMGVQDSSDLEEHVAFARCDDCKGRGYVKTGSLREGYEANECPSCNGLGYQQDLAGQIQANGVTPAPPLSIVTGPTAPDPELAAMAEKLKGAGWFAAPPVTVAT